MSVLTVKTRIDQQGAKTSVFSGHKLIVKTRIHTVNSKTSKSILHASLQCVAETVG